MNKNKGFTLVEISIVMIIIGLLIGGTFGGMKLIDNMKVTRTIRDFKTIESSALTFKDTYGRLPGDITNPGARLPGCTAAPCTTGGNGNRTIDTVVSWSEALVDTMEKFTFWSHLDAAGIMNLGTKNTTDMTFGEGQPEGHIQGGYRLLRYNGIFSVANTYSFQNTVLFITPQDSALIDGNSWAMPCALIEPIDRKIDDGFVYDGFVQGWACGAAVASSPYILTNRGAILYDLKGF